MNEQKLNIKYVEIKSLKPADYNPRKWNDKIIQDIKNSITKFGIVDPLIVNSALGRENIVIGGHLRLKACKELGYKEIPIVYINIEDLDKEKELNIRLNKNQGEFDFDLLINFDTDLLKDIGFENWELGVNQEKIDINNEWKDMPEFMQNKIKSYKTIFMHFMTEKDYKDFAELIKQNLTEKTKYAWYPKQDFDSCNRDKKVVVNEGKDE